MRHSIQYCRVKFQAKSADHYKLYTICHHCVSKIPMYNIYTKDIHSSTRCLGKNSDKFCCHGALKGLTGKIYRKINGLML